MFASGTGRGGFHRFSMLTLSVIVFVACTSTPASSFTTSPPSSHASPPSLVRKATAIGGDSPPSPTLETHEIVGCFGRIADKEFVLNTSDVQGTAASGYEFGVLQSGRPKWLCTYTERSGKTQGGGAEMSHRPAWCSLLFPPPKNGLTKSELIGILRDETTKFEMPLGAPTGAKQKAADPSIFSSDSTITEGEDTAGVALEALWKMLGGGDESDDEYLTKDTVSASLQRVAVEFGSQGDSMTFSAFEKAMKGQLP